MYTNYVFLPLLCNLMTIQNPNNFTKMRQAAYIYNFIPQNISILS